MSVDQEDLFTQMIHYALTCDQGHRFDSWFRSAGAFDALAQAGHLRCSICGSDSVKKAIMAPRVVSKSADVQPKDPQDAPPVPVMKTPGAPGSEIEKALAALRKKVEETSDYVGTDFTDQARAMHLGDIPERAIYGQARPDQARGLIDDGVPLLPLPFRPRQKMS